MKIIPLTQGYSAFVSDCDYKRLSQFSWRLQRDMHRMRYAIRTFINSDGLVTTISMHRDIMQVSRYMQVDHRDGNSLNNCRYNLRVCTHAQNSQHSRKCRKPTTSRYKGVCRCKGSRKWVGSIRTNNRTIHLGSFFSEEEAALAYNRAATKLFGKFAGLNVIEGKE